MKKAIWILIILVILLAITLASVALITAMKPVKAKEWTYTMMGAQVNYSIGQRVTSAGKVYECKYWDEGSPLVMFPPAANPDWWVEVQ